MGSPTTHYSIIKPDGTDEFLTEDFRTNYDIIDAAIYSARSRADDAYTLASAGGGGGGGTADNNGVSWAGAGNMNAGLAANHSYDYTLKQVVAPASGTLNIHLYCEFAIPSNAQQQFVISTYVDTVGTSAMIANLATDNLVPYANASGAWHLGIHHIGGASVTAGNHRLLFRVTVGTGPSSYNTFRQWKALVTFATPGGTY